MRASTKNWTLAGVGAVAVFILTMFALGDRLRPFMTSEAPPWAGVTHVDMVAQAVNEVKSDQQMMTETLAKLNAAQDRREYDAWTDRLAVAEARLKVDPHDSLALEMKRIATERIAELSKTLGANQTPAR